jgi:ADP-heptose:LPS heptosyltransferase
MVLKIVGAPDKSKMRYFQYLNTLVNRYSLHYNVKFTGFTLDVGNELRGARALAAPSVEDESFGRVIAEAFACGVPVVATKVGGYSEVIEHGVDGLLVPPRSADALADALLEIINQPHLAESFSLAGRKKAEEFFTLKKCAPEEEAVYLNAVNTHRVAVVKLSALGDLILIIPALKMLKTKLKNCAVTLVTLKKYAPIFSGSPYVDHILTVEEKYKKIKNIREISRKLRRMGFDYIFDFQNNWASQLISYLAFPRKSFGFSRKLGFLFTKKAKLPKKGSVDPLSSQELVTGLAGLKIPEKKLGFWPTSHDITQFNLTGEYLAINVSASPKWATKNWPKENMIKFIELFLKSYPDLSVLLLGDKNAVSTSAEIPAALPKLKIIDLCGKTTLLDLIEILRKVKVFITPDTAALHLAQSLGTAVVALFGPTNPGGHVVKSPSLKVITKNLPCSHCYRSKCSKHDCMRDIMPAEVLAVVKGLM